MISTTAANLTEQQQKNVLQFKSKFRPQPDLSGHGTYPANLKEQKHCCMEEWAKIHHTENDYSKLLLQATFHSFSHDCMQVTKISSLEYIFLHSGLCSNIYGKYLEKHLFPQFKSHLFWGASQLAWAPWLDRSKSSWAPLSLSLSGCFSVFLSCFLFSCCFCSAWNWSRSSFSWSSDSMISDLWHWKVKGWYYNRINAEA